MKRENSRTLDAVIHPGGAEPFPGVETQRDFQHACQKRQDWVLANMAHAAYKPSG
jgi:hypothetical protein